MIGLSQKLSISANYGYPFTGLPGGVYDSIPCGAGIGFSPLSPQGFTALYADKYPYLFRLLRVNQIHTRTVNTTLHPFHSSPQPFPIKKNRGPIPAIRPMTERPGKVAE